MRGAHWTSERALGWKWARYLPVPNSRRRFPRNSTHYYSAVKDHSMLGAMVRGCFRSPKFFVTEPFVFLFPVAIRSIESSLLTRHAGTLPSNFLCTSSRCLYILHEHRLHSLFIMFRSACICPRPQLLSEHSQNSPCLRTRTSLSKLDSLAKLSSVAYWTSRNWNTLEYAGRQPSCPVLMETFNTMRN